MVWARHSLVALNMMLDQLDETEDKKANFFVAVGVQRLTQTQALLQILSFSVSDECLEHIKCVFNAISTGSATVLTDDL